ncbi:hypothetical protein V1279_003374 [Bradyrhizobium sp. AZCC 1610]|uniref:terminase small subunit-like protein n=1 Tax=Bradyrhizobium sp. AZCC 1610 TaxID=3117020 RepID=UPI002FF12468
MTGPEIIPPEAKPKRPGEFSDEIFQQACDRMAGGEGLRKICEDPQMPSRQTFLRWIEKDTGRQAQYTAAREALMDWYAEEILTIAWDSSRDTIPADGKKPARCDNEWVNRSRLKVDTLKFLMAKLHPRRYGDKLPETVEEKTGVAELMRAIDGRTRTLEVRWEREIIQPIHDDNGTVINANDTSALRKRILELEERLGIKDGKPLPPKLLSYDPGPLPSRTEGEILYAVAQAIKRNVPKADQRPPEEVISEVMAEFEKLLQAKYAATADAA